MLVIKTLHTIQTHTQSANKDLLHGFTETNLWQVAEFCLEFLGVVELVCNPNTSICTSKLHKRLGFDPDTLITS